MTTGIGIFRPVDDDARSALNDASESVLRLKPVAAQNLSAEDDRRMRAEQRRMARLISLLNSIMCWWRMTFFRKSFGIFFHVTGGCEIQCTVLFCANNAWLSCEVCSTCIR